MTRTKKKAPRRIPEEAPAPTPENGELVQGTDAERAEAAQRARDCQKALAEVLQKFNCQVVAQISNVEPVGQLGDRVQVAAGWAVMPLPRGG